LLHRLSKKLTDEAERERIYGLLTEHPVMVSASNQRREINILQATMQAMLYAARAFDRGMESTAESS
jgi:ribonuclease HII